MIIRKELPGDENQIRQVNIAAFAQTAEAEVIDTLRQTCPQQVSLVAVVDNRIVGHILFTPAVIEGQEHLVHGMGLAPLAVLPEFQRQGIGGQLIQAGLAEMRQSHQPFVIVLGHPEYYPRFGFEPAGRYGIVSQYEGVPPEAFMILVFDQTILAGVSGVGKYRSEFDAAM